MPTELSRLIGGIQPERTVLFFGAGSSIPSRAPSVAKLISVISTKFKIDADGFSLSELSGIVEERFTRKELIESIRPLFKSLRPTGGIVNLPLFPWRSIFTTNYDDLVEQCYRTKSADLAAYSSNFDFTVHGKQNAAKLFKLHGTYEKDISDGHQTRLILTESDYDQTSQYRESLYDRLKSDLAGGHLIIIGHSLGDEHIKAIANRAAQINASAHGGGKVTLLLYQRDDNRAMLFEKRGFDVCFGGIDEFFAELSRSVPATDLVFEASNNPLEHVHALSPVTTDVKHSMDAPSDVSSMFNGWPASYGDVMAGLTFDRTVVEEMVYWFQNDASIVATLLGASGVGKTTAARQCLCQLSRHNVHVWEHRADHTLLSKSWVDVARLIKGRGEKAVLFIDEAHSHLQQVNELLDTLLGEKLTSLKVLCVSTRNHWNPRIKSPALYKAGKEFKLDKLLPQELDRLLNLVDSNASIRPLIENTFSGFSRYERRRRLAERCEADMFVCLKNIFASEKFDDIVLREYAHIASQYQDIYRIVAAMESSGIRVHRQLVMRLLGIPAAETMAALVALTDIVMEYSITEREGIYGWKCRHNVIADIVTRYKYPDASEMATLFERVIDCISPSYEIEIRTIRELCNVETGLPRIPDKVVQNKLLRKMMSVAPGERVPRHRLIRNLIDMGEFEKADTELRIFDKDFGRDGPVSRYQISLLTSRATRSPGILREDRIAILHQARELAITSIARFPNHKSVLSAYCEVGIELCKLTGEYAVFDAAIAELKAAEERVGDPEISKIIARYEARVTAQSVGLVDMLPPETA
ncbi:SIR2 family protein [Paraburkholderia strydomiana]|uniref:SIR2 family protein n=1 Tax=Paraburkholderia strydomiana TaxID=1245417 RepID=UPI0038B6B4B7